MVTIKDVEKLGFKLVSRERRTASKQGEKRIEKFGKCAADSFEFVYKI